MRLWVGQGHAGEDVCVLRVTLWLVVSAGRRPITHTHRPYTKRVGDVLFVNVGSVGEPKDGDWRAGYAILDLTAPQLVEFVRLEYYVASVAAAIRASELPDHFATDVERCGAAIGEK